MENSPSQKTPEKDRNYYISHFEEINEEDLEKPFMQHSFMNNFSLHVSMYLKDEDQDLETIRIKKEYVDLRKAMESINFDLNKFIELNKKRRDLHEKISDLSFSEDPDRLIKIKKLIDSSPNYGLEVDKFLLPLYKEMRRIGFEHQDLAV